MTDQSATERLTAAAAAQAAGRYVLRLFVAGATPASQRAIENLTEICEKELQGRYDLEVVDIYRHPEEAAASQIVAVPTLLRLLPEPVARVIGDLSDRDRVLVGLDLRPAGGG